MRNMDSVKLRESILDKISTPEIPGRDFSLEDFGVEAGTGDIVTAGIQAAIDYISGLGGGRLVVPEGHYLTGALRLRSGVELHLEGRGTVLDFVNEDIDRHYPVVYSHWEASPCYNYSALIYALDETDIALTGEGTLNGGAGWDNWWSWHHQVENSWSDDKPDLQLADRRELRRMNAEGVPVEERIFGPGHYLRPDFIQLIRCERILLSGFTLRNSPMWQLNPVMCRSLTVEGITFSSHGSNNDGCDPESCCGVRISGCSFDTGDDCISLKSGRDLDGRRTNMPCEDVLIEDNVFEDGHGGVALGSEMSGGIRRVLVENNHFKSPNLTYALRLKTNARRGGSVEDIIFRDIVMDRVNGAAVHGTMLYEDGRNGEYLPEFKNITIENITGHGGDYGIFLEAFEEVPITGLVLRNISIDGAVRTMRSMNWLDPVIENVVINGRRFPRPGSVRILGVPRQGSLARASAVLLGGSGCLEYSWECSADGRDWRIVGTGQEIYLPYNCSYARVTARDPDGNAESSRLYHVLGAVRGGQEDGADCADSYEQGTDAERLLVRGILKSGAQYPPMDEPIKRRELAGLLMGFVQDESGAYAVNTAGAAEDEDPRVSSAAGVDAAGCATVHDEYCIPRAGESGRQSVETGQSEQLKAAIHMSFLSYVDGREEPDGSVTRQEMATVAMQACGVNYRNASSTMPVCADSDLVGNNYGTNVARALYFGFMELDAGDRFEPFRHVTNREALSILNKVADFAGL